MEGIVNDTPETDAAAFDPFSGQGGEVVDCDFARNLERQRDEARAWIGEIFRLLDLPEGDMGALEKYRIKCNEAMSTIARLETELATARAEATKWEKLYDEVYFVLFSEQDRDSYKELETIPECAERLLQERNALRAAILSTLEENRHLADGENCTLAKLKAAVPHWK